MTAIFLPFAAEETYIYDAGQSFTFSEIYMSYYLTDKQKETVTSASRLTAMRSKVTAKMTILS